MLSSTTPPSRRHAVEVVTEAAQDFETLVICSHADQLVPAPLAAFALQHQRAREEELGGGSPSRRPKGSASCPSQRLLAMGANAAAKGDTAGGRIRPADIDGPNVCAPVTPFDDERFRHFIQQLLTVNRHYFETNRSPRGAQRDRLTSSDRRRHVAVLTDHMSQAQRERLALEVRNRIAAASPAGDKRVLELSFFTKNPNANARGREYLRASVPNTADIRHATSVQADYVAKCANPYNFAKAEAQMAESEAARLGQHWERYGAAMDSVAPVGAYELRSNLHLGGAGGLSSSTVDGGTRPRGVSLSPRRSGAGTNENHSTPAAEAPSSNSTAKPNNGDQSSDSDDDMAIPAHIAQSDAFQRAINGQGRGPAGVGTNSPRNAGGGAKGLSGFHGREAEISAHHNQDFNLRSREGFLASIGLGGPPVVYPEGKLTNPSASSNGGGNSARALRSGVSSLTSTMGNDVGMGGTNNKNTGSQQQQSVAFNAATDLQQKLNRATTLHAKEVAKASMALVAEDIRRRGGAAATFASSSANPTNTNAETGSLTTLFAGSATANNNSNGNAVPGASSPAAFLPALVDPNAAVVMGEIAAFTKGRFDKRSGAFTGAFSSGGQSMFANAEASDHSATARRRSLFAHPAATAEGSNSGSGSDKVGRAANGGGGKGDSSGDPSVEGSGGARTGMNTGAVKDKADKSAAGSAAANPRHAKFLISRTPFASTGGSGGGSSSGQTTNLLINAYLFSALFEQLNGTSALAPPQQEQQHQQHTFGASTFGASPASVQPLLLTASASTAAAGAGAGGGSGGAAVGVRQTVCTLANAQLPATGASKTALLHRLLDAFGDAVVGGTLRSANMLAAMLTAAANSAEGGGDPYGLASGGSPSGNASANFAGSGTSGGAPVDLSLFDFLTVLLTPEPIRLERAADKNALGVGSSSSGGNKQFISSGAIPASPAGSFSFKSDRSAHVHAGDGPSRAWLRPDDAPDGLPATELRLSPRKAAELTDTIATFAARPPAAPLASRVGGEAPTTMSITKTGAYKFTTTSPRRPNVHSSGSSPRDRRLSAAAEAEAALTPIQRHLRSAIAAGDEAVAAKGASLGGTLIATPRAGRRAPLASGDGDGDGAQASANAAVAAGIIPRPPPTTAVGSSHTVTPRQMPLASAAVTPQVRTLDLGLALSATTGGAHQNNSSSLPLALTARRASDGSFSGRSPRMGAVPYSSSYHDALLGSLITSSSSSGGGGKGRRRSVTIDDGSGLRLGITSSSTQQHFRSGGGGSGDFTAEAVALVRPFDQFFRVFDPDLTGSVRRDTFVLSLLAAAAAVPDNSSGQQNRHSQQQQQQRYHRRDAKSAVYFTTLWIVCLLLQQPATSEDAKLGELFALRDCLRFVALRERRLAAADKALRRLQQTIRLLTPRGAEDHQSAGGDATPFAASASSTPAAGALLAPPFATPSGVSDDSASNSPTSTAANAADGAPLPRALLCLERAAEHGIDSHALISYGDLAVALLAAMAEDGL